MQDWDIVRSLDNDLQQKLLFERPISSLYKKRIAILVGPHVFLKRIHDIYQIIQSLHHDVVVVADKQAGLPVGMADIWLTPTNSRSKVSFQHTDEALELLSSCQYIIAGIDIEISARWQLFLEQCSKLTTSHMVYTGEVIRLIGVSPLLLQNRYDDMYYVQPKELIYLAKYLKLSVSKDNNNSLLVQLSIMKQIADRLHACIVCYQPDRIVVVDQGKDNKAIVASHPQGFDLDAVMGLSVGLLSDDNVGTYTLDKLMLAISLLQKHAHTDQSVEHLLTYLKKY